MDDAVDLAAVYTDLHANPELGFHETRTAALVAAQLSASGRRELSQLLTAATDRGPTIAVPALCLATAAIRRPAIADHLADLVTGGPPSPAPRPNLGNRRPVLVPHRTSGPC